MTLDPFISIESSRTLANGKPLFWAFSITLSLNLLICSYLKGVFFKYFSLNPNFLNRLMSGLFSHYHKKNLDVFIGLQGGLSFCNFLFDPLNGPYKWSYSPTLSIKSGFRFFVWKYANFFLETTYFHNYLNNTSFGSVNLNEIIVSGGLGFQIERPKKHRYSNIPGTPSF